MTIKRHTTPQTFRYTSLRSISSAEKLALIFKFLNTNTSYDSVGKLL